MSRVIRISDETYSRLEQFAIGRFTNPNDILEEILDIVYEAIDIIEDSFEANIQLEEVETNE